MAGSRVGLEVEGHYAENAQLGLVFGAECYFEVDSVVVEHEASTYVIDQTHLSFSDQEQPIYLWVC